MIRPGEIAGHDSYGRPFYRKETNPRFYATTRWDRAQMLFTKFQRYTWWPGDGETGVRALDAIDYGDVEWLQQHPDIQCKKGFYGDWSNDWSWIQKPKIRRRNPVAKKIAKKVAKPTLVKSETKKIGKVAKVEKPAKAEKKAAAPKSTRNTGKTTGMKIAAYQDMLMAKNFKAKLTDEQLAAAMREEFPNAIAYTVEHVRGIRSQWNNGARASQDGVAPEKVLPEFDDEGKPVERRRGPAPSEKKASGGKKVKAGKKAKKEEPEEDAEEEDEEDEEEEEEEEEEE